MAKEGRPEKYRPDFHPDDFIEQSKQGREITQIALRWNIGRSTLYEWIERYPEFADAVKKGKQFCEGWYMNLGQAAMINQASINGKPLKVDLGWFVWMTKNVCKWTDKVQTEVSGQIQQNVSKVSEAKVKALLEKIRKDY